MWGRFVCFQQQPQNMPPPPSFPGRNFKDHKRPRVPVYPQVDEEVLKVHPPPPAITSSQSWSAWLKRCWSYRKVLWCLVAIVLELLYYGLGVVYHAILVFGTNPPPTLSYAAGNDDTQAVLVTVLGLIFISENLAYYYVFGAKFPWIQWLFTLRIVLWGLSMFFGVLTLVVRVQSPTNAHTAIACVFFGLYMVADLLAQAQRIYITKNTPELDALERGQRIATHAAEIVVWIATFVLGATFAGGTNLNTIGATQLAVLEYFSLGVALMLGVFKCLD